MNVDAARSLRSSRFMPIDNWRLCSFQLVGAANAIHSHAIAVPAAAAAARTLNERSRYETNVRNVQTLARFEQCSLQSHHPRSMRWREHLFIVRLLETHCHSWQP